LQHSGELDKNLFESIASGALLSERKSRRNSMEIELARIKDIEDGGQ